MNTLSAQHQTRLEQIVRKSVGAQPETSLEFKRLTGGASRETWLVTTNDRRYVLRIASTSDVSDISLILESNAIQAASHAGVPVPRVHATGHDEAVGGDYMVMDYVSGETLGPRIIRDPSVQSSTTFTRELGEAIARIHSIPAPIDGLELTIQDPLTRLTESSESAPIIPSGLALGLRWLRDNMPTQNEPTFLHGDFRIGNLLVDQGKLTAVLDWELIHYGDPVSDLGWLCAKVWRFGAPLPVGGVGTREQLLDGYESVAGWRPSTEQLSWWELYSTIRWGLMCEVMARPHTRQERTSVELAAIGRRAAEQEWDVLLALGFVSQTKAPDLSQNTDNSLAAGPYLEPTSDSLLAGVQAVLESQISTSNAKLAFDNRVAVNVVKMVRREIRLTQQHTSYYRTRLANLGLSDEASLSKSILSGELDHRWKDVVSAVKDTVIDRLAVANPRHFERPS